MSAGNANRYDVILIGSGISSLTAATLLAKHGKSVCILEQYKKPGGYLHSFKRFGRQFETGAHYLGALSPGEPFHTLLSYLGVYDADLFVPLDQNGFDEFHFPEFTFSFPCGYAAVVEKLSSEFPSEASAIARYFSAIQNAAKGFQTYHYSLELDLSRLLGLLETSLKSTVESLTKNPRLQSILYGHCYLHGVQPNDISFGYHALIVDSILLSAYGLKQGGDTVAKRFVQQIENAGGTIRYSNRVNGLHLKGDEVKEVELENGERLSADMVISGVHPKATFRWLPDEVVPPPFRKRLARAPESESIFGIYAEMRTENADNIPFHPLRNYYYFGTEDPSKLLTVNPQTKIPALAYVTRADRVPTSTDRLPLTIHTPGPFSWFSEWEKSSFSDRPDSYESCKSEVAEAVLDHIEQFVPGLRKKIIRYETSSALTNVHFNASEQGSGYGIYHSMEFTGMRAIGPRTRVKNLLLTGQSTLLPGLLGAATSGLRTAGEILGLPVLLKDLIRLRDS